MIFTGRVVDVRDIDGNQIQCACESGFTLSLPKPLPPAEMICAILEQGVTELMVALLVEFQEYPIKLIIVCVTNSVGSFRPLVYRIPVRSALTILVPWAQFGSCQVLLN